jgi:hypothetical protein
VLVAQHVAIAEQILGQENSGRHVAVGSQPKQVTPNGHATLGFGAVFDLAELFDLGWALDGATSGPFPSE